MRTSTLSAEHGKIRLWAVAFWLLVWQLASMAIGQQLILVSPVRVVLRLGQLVITSEFWGSVANTMVRITLGFCLGAVCGIAAATLSARFRLLEELLAPMMAAVKAIPVASFIILALILFSSKNLAILIAFLMVLPVFYTNLLEGIRSADRELLEMAQVFKIPPARRIRYLSIPQVFPYFRSACAAGLGMSWKSGVAAEVIGIPTRSIGEQLYNAKVYFDTPDLLAWTVVIVLCSLAFEKLCLWLLHRTELWTERMVP